MKTIGYGLVQIPIVTRYRILCIKRSLAGGVTSTGWQQILGCALRIVLLSSWGLKSIDYTIPQTAGKIIGVYVEFGLLSLQVANGIIILVGLWANNVYFLYPTLFIIPACFLTDIIIKGSCYAALFLTPKVTSFGVLSLVEVWFRGLSSMYGWIIIISYIYYKRNDWKLTEVNVQLNPKTPDRVSTIVRRTSSKSPFSRASSLSQRGRQSFLLRKHSQKGTKTENGNAGHTVRIPSNTAGDQNITEYDIALLDQGATSRKVPDSTREENSSTNNNTTTDSARDGESDILLGESAMMSMKRIPSQRNKKDISIHGSDKTGSMASKPFLPPSLQRSPPPRYKKRGGFVPEVLRTPSSVEHSSKQESLPPNRHSSQRSHKSVESGTTTTATTANTVEFSTSAREPSDNDETALLQQSIKKKHKSQTQPQLAHGNSAKPPSLPSRPPVGRISAKQTSTKTSGSLRMNWFKKVKDQPSYDSPVALGKKHVPDPVLV